MVSNPVAPGASLEWSTKLGCNFFYNL